MNMENIIKLVPGYVFEVNAVFESKGENPCYKHFNIHPSTAALYGDKVSDIVKIKMKIDDNQEITEYEPGDSVDYWGWFDYTSKYFSLIYGQRFLLNMCFPSGIDICEEHNQGKAYRLVVVP